MMTRTNKDVLIEESANKKGITKYVPRNSLKEFQRIPGVGKSMAKDFVDLKYKKIIDLKGADPEKMYQKLCAMRGRHIDRCVLYVFRCAVYFASNDVHKPELLKWWKWKDE